MQHEPEPPRQPSAARLWRPLSRFITAERALGAWAAQRPVTRFLYEFLRFGLKQAWACLFGGLMLALLIATHLFYPKGAALARYDFLVLAAVAIQVAMLRFKLETWEEARVIAIFHVVGTGMEIFKTAVGSWVYPEPSLLRLAGVPLFTGFMYAAVGSYIARAWRLLDFRFTRHPPVWAVLALALAIYVNFFTHHYVADIRLALFAASAILFGRCWIHYRVWHSDRSMPLLLGLVLVALFIWLAENVGTFTSAWVYPSQKGGWHVVSLSKLGAWYLLMLISYALVASVNRPRPMSSRPFPSRRYAVSSSSSPFSVATASPPANRKSSPPAADTLDAAEAAPLLCAGLIGYRALAMAGDARRIGLYGFGAAAHIIAQVAAWQGREVHAFTRQGDAESQAFARQLGACWVGAGDDVPPQPLHAALIFAPAGELVPAALRAIAKGGTVVCAGIHMSDIPAFPYDILWGERRIVSVANLTRRDGDEFLALAPRVPVRTEVVRFALEDANAALERLRRGALQGAAVLLP